MFIEEYDAKQLLAGTGVSVPRGELAKSVEEAVQIIQKLGVAAMIKAQVPTGKRGKGGGIGMAETPEEARQVANTILGSTINDFAVESILIEERASIAQELYAAITVDSSHKCPLLIFSTEGGMDIEEVHATSPEKVLMIPLDIGTGFSQEDALAALAETTLAPSEQEAVASVLVRLYAIYRQYDAQLVEINPLAITTDGSVIALDCKLVIDDSALYRQTNLPPERPQGTPLELEAKAQDFLFIELDGDVGVLANGAGLTMATMDAVSVHGGRPANFLEVGGMAYKRATPALALVLKNPNVKSLLVNLCGAYARTDVIAEGIVAGWKELQPTIPVAFCIHGTGEEKANQLIREELGIEPHEKMDDAVKAAIQMAAEG